MNTKPFDEILDECIGLLRAGSTIDECAAMYPEHAMELRAQLELARTMMTAHVPERASAGAAGASRSHLLTAAVHQREAQAGASNGVAGLFSRWTLLPRALPAVIAMLVLGSAAWGVSAATTGDPNPGTWFASNSSREDRVDLRGTIAAIDASSITITTADGDVTVHITPDTEFEDEAGNKIGIDAFAVGDFIKISALPDAAGGFIAREIEFEDGDDDRQGDEPLADVTATPDDRDDGDNSGPGSENSGPGNADDRDDDRDDDRSGPSGDDDHDDDKRGSDDDNSGPGRDDDRDDDDRDDDDRSGPGGGDDDDEDDD